MCLCDHISMYLNYPHAHEHMPLCIAPFLLAYHPPKKIDITSTHVQNDDMFSSIFRNPTLNPMEPTHPPWRRPYMASSPAPGCRAGAPWCHWEGENGAPHPGGLAPRWENGLTFAGWWYILPL